MSLGKLKKIVENATQGPWHLCNSDEVLHSKSNSQLLQAEWVNDAEFIATFNPKLVGEMLECLELAHNYLLQGKKQFRPNTTNSDVDCLLERLSKLESEVGE